MNINILTDVQYRTQANVGAVEPKYKKNNSMSFKTSRNGAEDKKASESLKVVILIADYNLVSAAFGNVCASVIVFLAVPVITSASAVCPFSSLKGE